jgi:hypothetical protein
MDPAAASAPSLNIEQLLALHSLTKDVAKLCQKQLRTYLETTAVLFRPRRILGDAIEGSERDVAGGGLPERNAAELRDLYHAIALRPFDLRPELKFPVESISTQFQLNEWEYLHTTKTDRGWQSIKVTTPLTWVISYASPYSLSILRQVLAGKEQRDPDAVRAFVLRACLMHLQIAKLPGLTELFNGLRFRIETRRSPELGDLPLITVSAPFSTLRPPDELVTIASGLAGGASFAEVLDLESVRSIKDPLREELAEILKKHGQEL